MGKIYYLLLVAILCLHNFADCKRTLSGGGRKSSSSSSGYSTRRTSNTNTNTNTRTQTHATSRPATSRPVSNYDNTKLSYGNTQSQPNKASAPAPAPGWNVNNKNQAPPPYSSVNNPSSISRNQAPPNYSPNAPAGHSTLQSSSYPRQSYANNAGPPSYGQATYHQPGQLPPGATMYGGGYHPQAGGYHPPAGGYHPQAGGYHPAPAPAYAAAPPTYYAPNQLPPGAVLYSQPPRSSGPGLGTGLIAGAIGGALLTHALTPSHNREVVHTSSGVSNPAPDSDRIIIINNGPPGSVTTNGAGATVIDSNQGGGMAAAPAAVNPAPAPYQPQDPATPLAPFQPGSTQAVNNQPANDAGLPIAAAAAAPVAVAAGAAMTDPNNANTTNPVPAGPAPGSIACYPIMVNQTDPNDPTKVTLVEQIACYEVPANPPPPPADQQLTPDQQQPQQSQMPYNPPASTTVENISQRTSSATVAESAQIKQSGSINVSPVSFWSTLTFAVFVSCSKILMS